MRITIEKNGKLYGNRPPSVSPCPFCQRSKNIQGRNGIIDSRGKGFRDAGWEQHVFTCYEKALADIGFYEKEYDPRTKLMRLGKIKDRPKPMEFY